MNNCCISTLPYRLAIVPMQSNTGTVYTLLQHSQQPNTPTPNAPTQPENPKTYMAVSQSGAH